MSLISVISCTHNEEEYVDRFLQSLQSSLERFPHEVIFVADRCSDSTVEKAQSYDMKLLEKKWRRWRNSYAEVLQYGFLHSRGNLISIMDVDLIVPKNFFRVLVPKVKGRVASATACLLTYPDTFMNRVIYGGRKLTRSLRSVGGLMGQLG